MLSNLETLFATKNGISILDSSILK